MAAFMTHCGICQDHYSLAESSLRPMKLNCDHCFCFGCCKKLYDEQAGNEGGLMCPECNTTTMCNDVSLLPQNWQLLATISLNNPTSEEGGGEEGSNEHQQSRSVTASRLVSKCQNPIKQCEAPPLVHCEKCELSFCQTCGDNLHEPIIMKSHTMKPIDTMAPKCPLHTDCKCDLFCTDDQVVVCLKCHLYGAHKGHNVQSFEEVAPMIRTSLEQRKQAMTQNDSALQNKLRELIKDMEDIEGSASESLKSLSEASKSLIECVEQRQRELEQQINSAKEVKLAKCNRMLQEVIETHELVKTVGKESNIALSKNDYVMFDSYRNIDDRLNESHSRTSELLDLYRLMSHPSVSFTPNNLQQVVSHIQQFGSVDRPVAPWNLQAVVSESAFTILVSWATVEFISPITAYTLEMKRNKPPQSSTSVDGDDHSGKGDKGGDKEAEAYMFHQILSSNVDSTLVFNIEPNSIYSFRVRAESETGVSEWSEIVSCDSPKYRLSIPSASSILMSQPSTFLPELIKLFDDNKNVSLRLLYQATRDGFTPQQFHAKCDTASRTLVVAKSESGHIGGGYASQSWSKNIPMCSEEDFLFSLYPKSIKLKFSDLSKGFKVGGSSSSSFGTQSTSTPAAGFGRSSSSSFGTQSTSTPAAGFGESSSSSSPFGGATGAFGSTPAFGRPSGFGDPAFGRPPSGFGDPAFGRPPSGFAAFGKPATGGFGQPQQAPAFVPAFGNVGTAPKAPFGTAPKAPFGTAPKATASEVEGNTPPKSAGSELGVLRSIQFGSDLIIVNQDIRCRQEYFKTVAPGYGDGDQRQDVNSSTLLFNEGQSKAVEVEVFEVIDYAT